MGRFLALTFDPFGEERHEGRIESTFGEQSAEQIGKALGHEEGFSNRTRADGEGHELVADETQDPADQGEGADRCRRFEKRHRVQARIACGCGGASTPASACLIWLWRASFSILPPVRSVT